MEHVYLKPKHIDTFIYLIYKINVLRQAGNKMILTVLAQRQNINKINTFFNLFPEFSYFIICFIKFIFP